MQENLHSGGTLKRQRQEDKSGRGFLPLDAVERRHFRDTRPKRGESQAAVRAQVFDQ